ncbi:hypothetical protein BY996DRAFT_7709293, partial [Phakopsora pachyrhizi]
MIHDTIHKSLSNDQEQSEYGRAHSSRSSENDYLLSSATRSQLLRLRRSHLLQLISSRFTDSDTYQSPTELESKTKESLVSIIIESRKTSNSRERASKKKSLSNSNSINNSKENHQIDPNCLQKPSSSSSSSIDLTLNHSKKFHTRPLTHSDSLPAHLNRGGLFSLINSANQSQTSFNNFPTTRSSSRQRQAQQLSTALDPGLSTSNSSGSRRRTRWMTREDPSPRPIRPRDSTCSSGSWNSIIQDSDDGDDCKLEFDDDQEQVEKNERSGSRTQRPARTPTRRRPTRRRKVVKFTGPRPSHPHTEQTPIAHRTRHCSNSSRKPLAINHRDEDPSLSSPRRRSSRKTLGTDDQLGEEDLPAEDSIVRSARRLRNGKVIRGSRRPVNRMLLFTRKGMTEQEQKEEEEEEGEGEG